MNRGPELRRRLPLGLVCLDALQQYMFSVENVIRGGTGVVQVVEA